MGAVQGDAATLVEDAPSDGAAKVPFSLFEGDRLNRLYARIGMGRFHRFSLLKRCLAAVAITYVPLALIAWPEGLTSTSELETNFFVDFAAYVQLIVALPLFLACEPIMDNRTREVTDQLVGCDIVKPQDQARLAAINAQIERARKSAWPDFVCLFWAFALSLVILVPEFAPGAKDTWHVRQDVHIWRFGPFHTLSYTGAWAFVISLPILNYTWLRFVWKVFLWSYYLFRITRMRLDLHPTHPDLTGGIGFISDAQGQFALFLLAYGLSNIAAPVGYQIVILGYEMKTMTVWGPMISFAIGGPLVFTLPLFMFTRQLFHAKHRALAIYRERVTEASRRIESYWDPGRREPRGQAPVADEMRELAELTTLSTMFTHIEKMRVVPFDWRSFGQLMASSFGSLATLVPLLQANGDIENVFELLSKVFRMLGGGGG